MTLWIMVMMIIAMIMMRMLMVMMMNFTILFSTGYRAVVVYAIKHIAKQPCRDSKVTGYKWLIYTLTGNETKCHDMFRMKPHVFFQLCNVLQNTYGLQHTRQIRLEELVGICLMTLAQGS
jgi:hypothetical protein